MINTFFSKNKKLIIFIVSFLFFDYFFKGYISITDKSSIHFIPFIYEYLNIVKGYRNILLQSSKFFLEALSYSSKIHDDYFIQINNKNEVQLVYSCLGFGIISFWISFIVSNLGSYFFKIIGIIGGIVALTLLNIFRLSIILISEYWKFNSLLPFDHHTNYNIISYLLIFILMWRYLKILETISDQK
jgi:exosortase/archaeosortase family protein